MNNQYDNGSLEIDQGVQYYQQQNYSMAFNCFLTAANKGNPIAMNNLSILCLNGQGVSKNEVASFNWMRNAALKGYVPAYYPLAAKYYDGIGVAKDLEQAKIWAEKIMQFGNEQDKQNARNMLNMIAKSQSNDGAFEVDQGIEFYQRQDYVSAFNCFLDAANKGNAPGMNNLSFFYANGIGIPKNEVASFEWMKKAAEKGNIGSYYPLASKYYEGAGVAKNLNLAKIWAEKTVQFGNERDKQNARNMLNMIAKNQSDDGSLEVTQGIEFYQRQDYVSAFNCFLDAANKGNAPGMNNLSFFYANGIGVPKNEVAAFEWMKKAAEKGNIGSYYPLASKYYEGAGVAKNLNLAKIWAEKTVQFGNERDKQNARNMLNVIAKSQPVKNIPKVNNDKTTFSPEIIKEFSEGCTLYNSGQYKQALEKFEKIGKLGHPGALRVIGQAYLDGKGVEVNVSNGYQFLRESAFRGDELAIKFIAKRLINSSEFGAWKAYAQNHNLKECEETLTNGIIHERSRTDTHVKAYDAREAMIKATECWKNYKFNRPDKGSIGTGAYAAYCYYTKAACFGNIEGLCGIAMFNSILSNERNEKIEIEAYRVAAYCGHSYAMYRTAQHYDSIDRKAANNCYLQAARWGYQPARYVCEQRGLTI